MQTLNVSMKVQRLTFLPEGHTEDVGWYFRDDQLWQEYGCQVREISITQRISNYKHLTGLLDLLLRTPA